MATALQPKRKRKARSVLKRIRQTERRAAINRANRSRLRSQVKKLRRALEAGDTARAQELLQPTLSVIDRSIQKGVLHRNTADRTKSRLALRCQELIKQRDVQASGG